MSGLTTITYFIINTVFTLALFTVWLLIACRYYRISGVNPFYQMVTTLTNPVINPLNRLLPFLNKPGQRIDGAAIILLLLLETLKYLTITFLVYHILVPIHILLIYVLADFIVMPCNLLFYAVLIRVIMSWINPGWHHPITGLLNTMTEPLLRLGRKIIPDISGFDFSPIVALVLLKIPALFLGAYLPLI